MAFPRWVASSCDHMHGSCEPQAFTKLYERCYKSMEQQRVAVRATVLIGELIHFVSCVCLYGVLISLVGAYKLDRYLLVR